MATLNSDPHVPVRTCVGCRSRRPHTELIRCALVEGVIAVGRGVPGRGAWLCGRGCIDAARRRRGFDRAFRTSVPSEWIDVLEESVNSDMS